MKTKEELLREAGYRYNYYRMVYINGDARKVLDADWVQNHSAEELSEELAATNDTGEWQFCLNQHASDTVIAAFLAEIDGRPAAH